MEDNKQDAVEIKCSEQTGYLHKTGKDYVKTEEWITQVNSTVKFISLLAFVAGAAFAAIGVWLVSISSDVAQSKINILGQEIETNSIGVACVGLGAITATMTARRALKSLDNAVNRGKIE